LTLSTFPETPACRICEWADLEHLVKQQQPDIAELLADEPQRVAQLSVKLGDCCLDLSRQSFDLQAWQALCDFARARDLPAALKAWFYGEKVNKSEDRAACHQLYRHAPDGDPQSFSAQAWQEAQWPRDALDEHRRMEDIAAQIRAGDWLGAKGKPITTIINIGIGGSHLGVEAAYQALAPYRQPGRCAVFIANIDPLAHQEALHGLDLAQCALVLASKSGTTLESLANFSALKQTFREQGIDDPTRHVFGVTAKSDALTRLGIPAQQIFRIPESVGGRFSLLSPIGFALAATTQPQALNDLRKGAAAMDAHTLQSPIERNMPVMLALASLWQHGLKGVQQHAILAYNHGLRGIVQHLQQLVMESNGKRLAINGEPAPPSGEVIWGGECSNGQHSYFQLLHQGNRSQHCDLLLFARSLTGDQSMQDELNAMALGQIQALTFGNQPGKGEGRAEDMQRASPGNIPLSLIYCNKLDAYTLGVLLALYENRTIAHAVLLGINPFDQWGVEHGKKCAGEMAQILQGKASSEKLDAGLTQLLAQVNNWRDSG